MSFFARLLGKKPQPKPVEKKANLESLPLDALVDVIKRGDNEQTAIAALQKISDQNTLINLAGLSETSSLGSAIQKAARQRIASLIDSGDLHIEQLSQRIANKKVLLALVGLSKSTAAFDTLLETVTDQRELAELAVEGSTSKVRQRAAEKITDKHILLQLLKETKNKDKTIFKIVKEKYDVFKNDEKRSVEILAAVTAAVQSLEQHSQRPFDAQFSAKFTYLNQQWETKKADANVELASRASQAIEQCRVTLDAISNEQVASDAERSEELALAVERQAHIQQLRSVLTSIINGNVDITETQALLKLLQSAWDALVITTQPGTQELKTVQTLNRVINEELAIYKEHGSLAEHKANVDKDTSYQDKNAQYFSFKKRVDNLLKIVKEDVPDLLISAQSSCLTWENAAEKRTAELQSVQRQVASLIRKANETVAAGVLGKALGIRRAIDEKLQNLQHLPNHLANQLEQLDETLARLKDWKDYAVIPKKQELIAQLEALENNNEHPEALATKIRRIQDEWRSLSKGGKDQDQDLWDKFHNLTQRVYEPCRIYFAKQAAIRQHNLASCKQLVAQLKDYLQNHDWSNANWKEVEKVIRVARSEWRNFSPTERSATQPVLEEFEIVLASIQQKLNDEFIKNAVLKKELIEQASQLIAFEDARKATDEIKKLQANWQAIGASSRKEEQHLWHEFRDVCDTVFAKRQQQTTEYKAELDANLTRARNLIAELDTLTSLGAQALTDAQKRVDEIRQEFTGLGQFPKAQVNDIKVAFNSAIDAFEQKLKNERIALKQQVWTNLFIANKILNDYELALVRGKLPDLADQAELQTQLDAIAPLPPGGLKALQQKLTRANASTNLTENLGTLRELCVRAEIASDITTPAAEQALRTAVQVAQLQQKFGRKGLDAANELEDLVFEWIGVGAVEQKNYDDLVERFNRCRLALAQ